MWHGNSVQRIRYDFLAEQSFIYKKNKHLPVNHVLDRSHRIHALVTLFELDASGQTMSDVASAQAVAKGTRLLNTTRALHHGSLATSLPQSRFTTNADLTEHEYMESSPDALTLHPLRAYLQNLGVDDSLDTRSGKNVRIFDADSPKATVGAAEKKA
jgi:hypothetical protein